MHRLDPASGCATVPLLQAPEGVAVSPDGATVYAAAAFSNALLTLTRDPATGGLAPSGCATLARHTGLRHRHADRRAERRGASAVTAPAST